MMKICKTCKFWGRHFENVCDKEGTMPYDDLDNFGIEAQVDDDQGLDTQLVTGPDFGCVHHQEKEDSSILDNLIFYYEKQFADLISEFICQKIYFTGQDVVLFKDPDSGPSDTTVEDATCVHVATEYSPVGNCYCLTFTDKSSEMQDKDVILRLMFNEDEFHPITEPVTADPYDADYRAVLTNRHKQIIFRELQEHISVLGAGASILKDFGDIAFKSCKERTTG